MLFDLSHQEGALTTMGSDELLSATALSLKVFLLLLDEFLLLHTELFQIGALFLLNYNFLNRLVQRSHESTDGILGQHKLSL